MSSFCVEEPDEICRRGIAELQGDLDYFYENMPDERTRYSAIRSKLGFFSSKAGGLLYSNNRIRGLFAKKKGGPMLGSAVNPTMTTDIGMRPMRIGMN